MIERWDEEFDLVVVGYGGAGAAAAITAHDAGGSVVLLEKHAEATHTPSTRMSGGWIMGVVGDIDSAAQAMDVCADGATPAAVSRAWAEQAATVIDWVNNLRPGYSVAQKAGAEHPHIPGAEALGGFGAPGTSAGYELWEAISYAVGERHIEIRWESPARRLLTDASGEVIGVEVTTPAGVRRIKARRGVALTSGGFEFNEEMKRNFLPAPAHFYGNPGNTGDGIAMAQKIGAQLWHMTQIMGRGMAHFVEPDGTVMNFSVLIDMAGSLRAAEYEAEPFGYLITDTHGQRFANEQLQAAGGHSFNYRLLEYDPLKQIYPRNPCYLFFDERRRLAGPMTPPNMGLVRVGLYDWSQDNSKEVARGWISKGRTIAEAGRAAGMADPDAAQAALAQYSEACRTGSDPHGRPKDTLVPLEAPFYCLKLYPGGTNTLGGPRRNEYAQIIDAFGEPIPGLYGAGELGGAMGNLYPAGGASISDALCFGRIIGAQVMTRNAIASAA